MAQTVFISHSGADTAQAGQVRDALAASGIGARLDRAELVLGDSFLAFMEQALATSDYCLLLWSRHAAATPWVQLEWEAALYRSVNEKRAFLVAARLEDTPLPSLLAPRLRVDLFPGMAPGLATLIATWCADRQAEAESSRPVGALPGPAAAAAHGDEVYLTSELFAIATPWPVDLRAPAALMLQQAITQLRLPRQIDHAGLLGVRMSYALMHRDHELDPHRSLREQQVEAHDTLWLASTMTPFAASLPIIGTLQPQQFRFKESASPAEAHALSVLQAAVRAAGAGP